MAEILNRDEENMRIILSYSIGCHYINLLKRKVSGVISFWKRLENVSPITIDEFSNTLRIHARETVIVAYSFDYKRVEMNSIVNH